MCPPEEEDIVYDINGADPLCDDAKNLWLIVGRTDSRQFVQYLVLQCNWKLRWVVGHGDRKDLYSCWGCVRNANSYTSGVWNDYENSPPCWKQHGVSLLIAGNPLEPYCHSVKMKDAQARWIKKYKDWAISSQASNRGRFNAHRLKCR